MNNSGNIEALLAAVTIECLEGSIGLIKLTGSWVQSATIQPVEQLYTDFNELPEISMIVFKVDNLKKWDSRLPTYLLKIIDHFQSAGVEIDLSGLPEGIQNLLKLACIVPERTDTSRNVHSLSIVARIGKIIISGFQDAKRLITFIGEILLACYALIRGKARFRSLDMFICIQEAGPEALAIVTLISLLVGLILAFVGAVQLAMFGAQIYIADLVALGTVREMGALMTAIIMSGRTGAAYAAQLGTMNVNNEIDAIRTMGISPMEFLVMPRMLALILMMPLLCLYADFMGILGGALVSTSVFDVSLMQYYNETSRAVHVSDFAVGLFKSLVFAVLIATAGCMRGMQCGHSASAVGDASTAAVVNSIVYIVIADSLITLMCNSLGI